MLDGAWRISSPRRTLLIASVSSSQIGFSASDNLRPYRDTATSASPRSSRRPADFQAHFLKARRDALSVLPAKFTHHQGPRRERSRRLGVATWDQS